MSLLLPLCIFLLCFIIGRAAHQSDTYNTTSYISLQAHVYTWIFDRSFRIIAADFSSGNRHGNSGNSYTNQRFLHAVLLLNHQSIKMYIKLITMAPVYRRRHFIPDLSLAGTSMLSSPGLTEASGSFKGRLYNKVVVGFAGTNSRGLLFSKTSARQPNVEIEGWAPAI